MAPRTISPAAPAASARPFGVQTLRPQSWTPPGALPVGRQPRCDVTSRNLSDDVAPKEGTVDHPHGFRVPVEFGFLWGVGRKKWIERGVRVGGLIFSELHPGSSTRWALCILGMGTQLSFPNQTVLGNHAH